MIEYIYHNIPGNPQWRGSFYERLAEDGEWDIDEFWRLHFALIEAAKNPAASENINRSLALNVVQIHLRVSGLICAHFDNNDVFKIENLSREEIYAFKERLDLAVAGVFSGEVLPESSFDLKCPNTKNA